jgi:hypothetical protein
MLDDLSDSLREDQEKERTEWTRSLVHMMQTCNNPNTKKECKNLIVGLARSNPVRRIEEVRRRYSQANGPDRQFLTSGTSTRGQLRAPGQSISSTQTPPLTLDVVKPPSIYSVPVGGHPEPIRPPQTPNLREPVDRNRAVIGPSRPPTPPRNGGTRRGSER